MLQFMNLKDAQTSGEVLRSYVRRTGIGCNGIKLRFKDGIQHHGTHIRRKILPTDLLAKLDSGMYLSCIRKSIVNLLYQEIIKRFREMLFPYFFFGQMTSTFLA